jgi:multidrug efflux system outer membrane protein
MKLFVVLAVAINMLASCVAQVPNVPPATGVPATYRDGASTDPSIAGIGWWRVIRDDELKRLIRTALTDNFDVRIAAERVIQAQDQVTIVNANSTVQLGVAGNLNDTTTSGTRAPGTPHTQFTPAIAASASYQVDLFGQLRNATAAARAQLLATEYARETVVASLVAGIALAYVQLRELDTERDIATRTIAARKESLDLVKLRLSGGVGTLQDVRQSEQLYYGARATLDAVNRQIVDTGDLLSTLLGHYPRAGEVSDAGVPFATVVQQFDAGGGIATGVPAELLTARPDIRAAEAQLEAANAQVNVARALIYPQITLGASAGVGAAVINGTYFGPQYLFSLVPQIVQSIFNGGSLRANVHLTDAQRRAAVLTYLKTVVEGVREVDDALSDESRYRAQAGNQAALADAATDSARLADVRFRGGVTTYLEVLDSDTRAFDAQLQLARTQLAQIASTIVLYQALGGGWLPEPGS